jgi:hypothetical protein
MATKKTSIFTLTERLTIAANSVTTFATIDLGSYVDVGDRQALQIHSVDFIYQGTNAAEVMQITFAGDSETKIQVTDLNRGGFAWANDRSLVASGQLNFDAGTNQVSNVADLYPDNYGKGSDDGRYVVNDMLYITGKTTGLDTATAKEMNVTVRVNASIVTLGAKDFMAIAIQSTAADN